MAQDATVAQVKARIQDIAAQCVTVVTAEEAPGTRWVAWEDRHLPAVIVRLAGTAARERLARGSLRVTRNYTLILYVERLSADTAAAEKAAIDTAEALLNELPVCFLAHPTLDGIVFTTAPMTDTGAAISPYAGVWYSAITYTLPVVTIEGYDAG